MSTGLKFLFLCLLFASSLATTFAQDATRKPRTVHIGLELGAEPLSSAGPDGRPIGYSVDLLEAIAAKAGFSPVFVIGPWDQIFARFRAGEIDALASLVYTAERDHYIDYSVPHLFLKGAAFIRRDAPPLTSENDLGALRIAVLRDDFTHEFIKRRGWAQRAVFVKDLNEALHAVSTGQCDAVFATRLVGQRILRESHIKDVAASDVPFPDLDFDLHMGVRAGDADTLALLNLGLARIIANGTYDAIYEKWIGPLHSRAIRLKDIQLYLVPGLLIVLGLATVFIWQRRVLRKVRAQAEALRASEDRLKLVLEVGAHGLWEYDYETKIVKRDPAASAISGYTIEELTADPQLYFRRIDAEDLKLIEAARTWTDQPGNDFVSYDYRLKTKSGEQRWISTRGKVIARKPDGSALHSVGTNTDITELKQKEAERAQIQTKMLDAQKLESLGVLSGGIAHDFNNLLAVILGNAGLAKLALPPDSNEAARSLTQIETASQRASDLCRQMLAYAGQGSHVREHVDLSALITNTTELLRLSISKSATLTFNLAPGAPWVDADRSQLQQVVMNLVINASEALGPDTGLIRLATGHGSIEPARLTDVVYRPEKIAGTYAWVEVADTGHGMTAETRAKIFEPFFTTKFTGRGLGLAAVLGIVRAHNGIFTLHSEVGRGSTFRIYFPAADPTALFMTKPTPTPPPAPAGAVLVADDEPTVLLMVTKALEHHGFRVVATRNGREAVQQFAAQPGAFCAIILDLTMPVLDGAHALREIRALDPAARLLVMSGYGQQETLAKLRDAGRVDFLPKPFTTAELLSAIARLEQP